MDLVIENHGVLPYRQAYDRQVQLVEMLHRQPAEPDRCLVLEHPAVFTLGRNGSTKHVSVDESFLRQRGIELIRVERGGEVTYHGPGQLVCYPIINLRRRGLSVVDFVNLLEEVMLRTAAACGVSAGRDERNRGVWVHGRKLGSVGIAIRHGITFHGLAFNVSLDLEPFTWVNPCGLTQVAITSLERECGSPVVLETVRQELIIALQQVFTGRRQVQPSESEAGRNQRLAKPKWLKKPLPSGGAYEQTRRLIDRGRLQTVCREARCPNQFECYGRGTATFMIMGQTCTRNCRFCAVGHGRPEPLDDEEPRRIATAVAEMGLDHVVLTSVTRDDLADGGAGHFIQTIGAIREMVPGIPVEILIPDLLGNWESLGRLCAAHPEVINHNIETVPRLYDRVRPQADYRRSLDLLQVVRETVPTIVTKSGLMLGLGETLPEIWQTLEDLRRAGCQLLTLGQYLQPTRGHLPVHRYLTPEEFNELRLVAFGLGFTGVASGPHVRSSFQAGQLFRQIGRDTTS